MPKNQKQIFKILVFKTLHGAQSRHIYQVLFKLKMHDVFQAKID